MNEDVHCMKTVRIITSEGKLHYMEVYEGETIRDVKDLLYDRYGYSRDMKFTFMGANVADDFDVSRIKHTNNDYLKCVIPMKQRTRLDKDKVSPISQHEATEAPHYVTTAKSSAPVYQKVYGQGDQEDRPKVHRILAPPVGNSKRPTRLAGSSINMLLSD